MSKTIIYNTNCNIFNINTVIILFVNSCDVYNDNKNSAVYETYENLFCPSSFVYIIGYQFVYILFGAKINKCI